MQGLRDPKRLAAALVERRGELGMTQEQFAEAADVSVKTVQRIELAGIVPRAETLGKLDRGGQWPTGHTRRVLEGEAEADVEPPRSGGVPTDPGELIAMPGHEAVQWYKTIRERVGDERATKWLSRVIDLKQAASALTAGESDVG